MCDTSTVLLLDRLAGGQDVRRGAGLGYRRSLSAIRGIHTYIYIYIYIYIIYIYIYTCIYVYVFVCIYVYIYIYV